MRAVLRVSVTVVITLLLAGIVWSSPNAQAASQRPVWAPCYRPSVPAGVRRRKCLICRIFAQSGECSWALHIAHRESRYATHKCDYAGGDHCGLFQLSGSLRRVCGTHDRSDPNWRKFRAYRYKSLEQVKAAYCVYRRAGRQPWSG